MSAKNLVDPNRHDKLSKLPGTPQVRKLASSYNDSGLHEDSGFISPPTLVKFEAVTPHGYYLRHMTSQAPSRWSSTPLNVAPDEENLPTPTLFKSSSTPVFTIGDHPPKPQLVEIVDFKSRLDSLEHHESDSGKESKISLVYHVILTMFFSQDTTACCLTLASPGLLEIRRSARLRSGSAPALAPSPRDGHRDSWPRRGSLTWRDWRD